jgi:hypothetical protein
MDIVAKLNTYKYLDIELSIVLESAPAKYLLFDYLDSSTTFLSNIPSSILTQYPKFF